MAISMCNHSFWKEEISQIQVKLDIAKVQNKIADHFPLCYFVQVNMQIPY